MCSLPRVVTEKQKKDKEGQVTWDELVASIVSNTSMTVQDIKNLSYPELEGLMEGMTKNSEREQDELNGIQRKQGDATDFMEFMQNQ
jgi:hypothetical protein